MELPKFNRPIIMLDISVRRDGDRYVGKCIEYPVKVHGDSLIETLKSICEATAKYVEEKIKNE